MRNSKALLGHHIRGLPALGIAAILIIAGGNVASPSVLVGQASPSRLTVRPHEMAAGTQTTQAGEYPLDSITRGLVYIPPQAVGTRRVPLVVTLTGGGVNARREMNLLRPLSDKYGMILLVLDHPSPAMFDAALKQVLQKFAIDPGKIAVGGVSEGGANTVEFGRNNLDVFSRFAPMSANGVIPYSGTEPRNAPTQAFISAGIGESSRLVINLLKIVQEEREQGRTIKPVLNIRLHENRVRDHDYMWQWLRDGWATPDPKASSLPSAAEDVVLTPDILDKMTKFWTQFKTNQDSSHTITLSSYQKELTLLVGQERVFVYDMVDLPTIASTHAWVDAALKKAGLNPQQEESYRSAFISARATKIVERAVEAIPVTSALGQNLAFLKANEQQANALLDLMNVPRCETTIQLQFGC